MRQGAVPARGREAQEAAPALGVRARGRVASAGEGHVAVSAASEAASVAGLVRAAAMALRADLARGAAWAWGLSALHPR